MKVAMSCREALMQYYCVLSSHKMQHTGLQWQTPVRSKPAIVFATGAKVTEETTLPAALLMNLIFLCGLFTFAVVLGFVSEEIKSQLRSVKAGNYAGTPFYHIVTFQELCFLHKTCCRAGSVSA